MDDAGLRRVAHDYANRFPPGQQSDVYSEFYVGLVEGYQSVKSSSNPAPGVKFVLGIRGSGASRRSETQSVLFDKSRWTVASARKWLSEHGYRGLKVDEGGEHAEYYRFRQTDPSLYRELRVIPAGRRKSHGSTNPAGSGRGFGAGEAATAYDYGFREGDAIRKRDQSLKTFLHDSYRKWLHLVADRNLRPQLEAEWRRGYEDGVGGGAYSPNPEGSSVVDAIRVKMSPRRGAKRNPGYKRPDEFEHVYAWATTDAEAQKIADDANWIGVTGGGKFVPGSFEVTHIPGRAPAVTGTLTGNRRSRRNPESDAAALYEDFHGRPSTHIEEHQEEIHVHENLTELGTVVELIVETVSGLEAAIAFDTEDPDKQVKLASSEDGKQLFFIGGDQSIDLNRLKLGSPKLVRDLMLIGVLKEITYHTEKGFDKFQPTDYYHKLGEESGYQPVLLYDSVNRLLSIAGGAYQVKSEGIVD